MVNRIKRAQGQLGGVLRMVEEGRDTQEIVNQLKAVSRAIDRAGFAIIAAQLREAARDGVATRTSPGWRRSSCRWPDAPFLPTGNMRP